MKEKTVGCLNCGFVFTNPVHTEEFYNHFYANNYRDVYKKESAIPSREYEKKFELNARAKWHIDWISQYLDCSSITNWLDIGCADATFLEELLMWSPQIKCIGVEPDIRFREYANSKNKFTVYASINDLEPNSVQFLSMSHVFEHIIDYDKFFLSIDRVATAGHYLYLDVPDLESYSSINDIHIAHVSHFSVDTLELILKKYSYEVIAINRHSPPKLPPSIRVLSRKIKTAENSSTIISGGRRNHFSVFKKINKQLFWTRMKKILKKIIK
jgi:hypothetical protein